MGQCFRNWLRGSLTCRTAAHAARAAAATLARRRSLTFRTVTNLCTQNSLNFSLSLSPSLSLSLSLLLSLSINYLFKKTSFFARENVLLTYFRNFGHFWQDCRMYVGTYVPRKQCENLGLEITFLIPRNRSDNDLERDKFDAKLSASKDNVMI
jgi:hypothetical protein